MLIFTIVVNIGITFFNLYLVFKIWQLRKRLYLITQQLNHCEILINTILRCTPDLLISTKNNLTHFRQKYQLLQIQLAQIKQMIAILNWVYLWWRKYPRDRYRKVSQWLTN